MTVPGRVLAAALAALCSGLLLLPRPVAAEPSATVSGKVLVGSTGAPVAATVTLNGYQGDTERLTRSAAAGRTGAFTFTGLETGSAWTYVVTARYRGVDFPSDRFGLEAGQRVDVTLDVYEATTSAADVSLASWTVWVDLEDAGMAVQQDVELVNEGTTAYTGSVPVAGTSPANRAAVVLPLARGAGRLQFLGRFETCCAVATATAWAHTRPVTPGRSSGTVRYEAPVATELTFPATLPTSSFVLLVPSGTRVEARAGGSRLTAVGTSSDRGITYDVYRSAALSAGAVVTVSLGLAAPAGSVPWLWVTLAGLVVVGGGLATVGVVRRRAAETRAVAGASARPSDRRPKPRRPPAAAATRAGSQPASRKPGPRKSTLPDTLLDELAMLDLAHENGSLPDEAAYRRVRASLLARLVSTTRADER